MPKIFDSKCLLTSPQVSKSVQSSDSKLNFSRNTDRIQRRLVHVPSVDKRRHNHVRNQLPGRMRNLLASMDELSWGIVVVGTCYHFPCRDNWQRLQIIWQKWGWIQQTAKKCRTTNPGKALRKTWAHLANPCSIDLQSIFQFHSIQLHATIPFLQNSTDRPRA